MEIQLKEVLANTRRMAQILAHHSGRPLEQVERDIDRDYFLTAEEALEYGLIDEVLAPRRGLAAAMPEVAESSPTAAAVR
jgi:ATP-dependent Clp protease protease subunit